MLPDDWNEEYYILNNLNNAGSDYESNDLSINQWRTIEQHGAVFLPNAGYRYGTTVANIGNGYYWSSSAIHQNTNNAYGLWFYGNGIKLNSGLHYRYYGYSVRLVYDYNP